MFIYTFCYVSISICHDFAKYFPNYKTSFGLLVFLGGAFSIRRLVIIAFVKARSHLAFAFALKQVSSQVASQVTKNEWVQNHSSDATCDATCFKCRQTSKENIANADANARCEWALIPTMKAINQV